MTINRTQEGSVPELIDAPWAGTLERARGESRARQPARGSTLVDWVLSRQTRNTAATLVCGLGCVVGASLWGGKVTHAYPLKDWFFWHWARVWLWEALWVAACLSLGDWLLLRLFRVRELPALEALVVHMALGVTGFVVALFALGALHLFRPAFALALPVACIAVNVERNVVAIVRTVRTKRNLQLTRGGSALFVVGIFCLGALYLEAMTPAAIGCDGAWFHLTAAEDYAREGRLVPFIADWAKTLPQLTSILHTWAFVLPGLRTEVRWMMALHTEFILFVFTLAGVVASVRWLRRCGSGHELAWTAFFLFPEIFVYDQNIQGNADHIQAFFALPLLVLSLRASERANPRMAALAGVMAGAAMLTKAQAVYLVVPIALMLATTVAVDFVRRSPRERLRQDGLVLFWFGTAAVLTLAPHLIKQWVFYHNPFYPFMMSVFTHSWPAVPDASTLFYTHLAHVASLFTNFEHSLKLVFRFPFHFESDLNQPFLGPLFVLLLPLALLRSEPRIWKAAFVALAALYAWASVFSTPRNLQTFLPILVALTAVAIAEVWQRGKLVRVPLLGLLALQVVWSSDELFSSGYGRLEDTLQLIRSGAEGKAKSRFDSYRAGFRALDRELPHSAVLLMHATYSQLGINRRTLLDWLGFQGLIDYRPMRTARDVYEQFHDLGITHIVIDPPTSAHSRQEEVLFDAFVYRHATSLGKIGEFVVWKMPAAPPASEAPYSAVLIGVGDYADGLYRIELLDQLDFGPRVTLPSADVPLEKARAVDDFAREHHAEAVILGRDANARRSIEKELERDFDFVASYTTYTVYLARK